MSRRYPGQRAIRITARTLHIACAVMVLGAEVYGGESGSWGVALAITGLVIIADDLYKYGIDWLRYVHGWAVLIKVALVIVGATFPQWMELCLWVALVVGGLISHAPGAIRQYPLWGTPGPCATRQRARCATGLQTRSPDP